MNNITSYTTHRSFHQCLFIINSNPCILHTSHRFMFPPPCLTFTIPVYNSSLQEMNYQYNFVRIFKKIFLRNHLVFSKSSFQNSAKIPPTNMTWIPPATTCPGWLGFIFTPKPPVSNLEGCEPQGNWGPSDFLARNWRHQMVGC